MKIFAIGKNYVLHNAEMDGDGYRPSSPVVFMKPESALLRGGRPFFLPEHLGRVDYEAELVVRISRLGRNVSERFAHRYYDAVTVGIDFTARDLQRRLKDAGHPWELSKAFDSSAAIGSWRTLPEGGLSEIGGYHFSLDVNGERKQSGWSGDMIFGVDELISYISRFFTLKTGDLLFTGTPAGIGPISIGDHLEGMLEEERVLDFHIR